MKLAELASELSLSRSDILAFLATHDLKTGSQENLAPEQVARVRRHFARTQAGEHKALSPAERPDKVAHKPKTPPSVERHKEEEAEPVLSTDVKAERVERAKVALPGLKVLGKIDLSVPSAKPKDDGDEKRSLTPPKKAPKGKEPYRTLPPRKPASKVSEAAKEAKIEQTPRQKPRRSKKHRERRAQRYRKKVATYRVPIKSLREEQASEYEVYEEGKDIALPEKSWLSRLVSWFTSS